MIAIKTRNRSFHHSVNYTRTLHRRKLASCKAYRRTIVGDGDVPPPPEKKKNIFRRARDKYCTISKLLLYRIFFIVSRKSTTSQNNHNMIFVLSGFDVASPAPWESGPGCCSTPVKKVRGCAVLPGIFL